MGEINALDLKGMTTAALIGVFDTMLSMEVEVLAAPRKMDGERIVGSVSFAGKVMGSVNLLVSKIFARIITAAMLDMDEDEIEEDEEINDVMGELSNMIGGDLKSRFCDAGLKCELSIPTTTSGADFKIDVKGWAKHEIFVFGYQQHTALVEVYLKQGT